MQKVSIIFIALIVLILVVQGEVIPTKQASNNVKENKLEEAEMEYFHMPAEDLPHEGTWLIWPHQYTYGIKYQKEIEPIWLEMTKALHVGEQVHIIAYNEREKKRIQKLLVANKVNMKKVDFLLSKSDDVWIRDTGPIFVYDKEKELVIADFKFDGWGEKVAYEKDDKIPVAVGVQRNIPVRDISAVVLEGGSIELDGKGTMMATLSSVVSQNRNPKLKVEQMEAYMRRYLGITNFIWLEGVVGEDITDAHIDGIARFIDENTILTVSKEDFTELYEGIKGEDYIELINARNAQGRTYDKIEIPLTKENVLGVHYKGSYLNYYIGNEVVLIPIYEDENDDLAIEIIQNLYPDKEMIPIHVSALYPYGGMIHCVTQQQPIS